MMTHFTQYYPQVRFEIHEGNTFQLIEMLQAGIIDLGIVRTPFGAEQLKICYGPQEPMVAVMTPDRAIAFTQPKITLAQLSGQPLIFYRRFEQLLTNCMQNEGLNLQVACLNDDARTTFNWAANNFGIGILPLSIIQTLNNNNMVVKIIDCEKLVTRLAVIWDEHRYQSPLAAQFIEDFQKSVNSVISVKDDK
jgi:DNA-binding transcriptional LysR family regulator